MKESFSFIWVAPGRILCKSANLFCGDRKDPVLKRLRHIGSIKKKSFENYPLRYGHVRVLIMTRRHSTAEIYSGNRLRKNNMQ